MLVAAVGVAALLAGVLALAGTAGAGYGGEKPWPILKVMKTIGQADYPDKANEVKPPVGTTFSITVTCDYPVNGASVAGEPFPETVLTFDETGAPKSADQGGWMDLGDGYWTYQGKALKYKECTAIETDVTDPDGTSIIDAANLFMQYKCDADATLVENGGVMEEDADAEGGNGAEFGCVTPEPFGEYVPDSEQATVQFTAFWDLGACGVEWSRGDSTGDVDATDGSWQPCQETGTLTVDNFDPEWNVLPAAIVLTPTFTG